MLIADYTLAPEFAFPAAVEDIKACYRRLVEMGITKVGLTGDSAGGNLNLVSLGRQSVHKLVKFLLRHALPPTLVRLRSVDVVAGGNHRCRSIGGRWPFIRHVAE